MSELGPYCDHDFHLDECKGCGLAREDRDGPMLEVVSAANYTDGYEQARGDLAELVAALPADGRSGIHGEAARRGYEKARRDVLALIDELRPL